MAKCIVCSCLLLAIPAAASAADLSPIVCDGVYPYHLQGVATDGTNIFWSFTTVLAKTDLAGRCLAKVERATACGHMGDLCCHGGKVFVGVNNGGPGGTRPGDEVWVYDAETLVLGKRIPTPQTIFCNNGIEWYGGYFFVVGSAPADHELNYVWQFTEDFRFKRCMPIRSGKTLLGVQTICHLKSLGKMAFGHYGSTPVSKGKPADYVFFVKPEDLVQPPVSGIPDSENPPVIETCGSESWHVPCGMLELNGVVFKALTSQGKDNTWTARLLPIAASGTIDMDNPALTHNAANSVNDSNVPLATREPVPEKVTERIELLKDGDISKHWYTWLKGEGRDSDQKKVFTAEGNVLKVSGEGMGCVTTRKAYRDYRLSLEFRYVDNEVQLNKTAARDGGILFHSTGEDGVFGPGIWMSSFEYNIIQGATGDLIVVGDDKGKPGVYRCKGRVDPETKGKACQRWKVDGEEVGLVDRGRIRRPDVSLTWKNLKIEPLSPNEKPIGDWNKVDVVCSGDKAEFYFNGMKTGEYWDLNPTSGRIQLQSEGFGIEYRNIVLEPVDAVATSYSEEFDVGELKGVEYRRERVYSYLRSLPKRSEKRILVGQQCDWWPNIRAAGLAQLTKTFEKTGKFPALAGFDYCETMKSVSEPILFKPPRWREMNPFIKEWAEKGGLVTISAHMTNPWTGTNAWDLSGSERLPELLQQDTESSKVYWRVVEGLADGLEDLQKSGIVVLWRPFHECEGGWFWWGGDGKGGSRATVFKKLWREMHDYMVRRRKLKNLIWVFNGKSCHYPGDDVVDFNSADIYDNDIGKRIAALMPGIASNDSKPFALAEFGPFHAQLKVGEKERFDYSGFAEEVLSATPNCAYFLAWHTQWSLWYNNAEKLMSDPRVVTLDDLRKELNVLWGLPHGKP